MTLLNPLFDFTTKFKPAHLTIAAASSQNHFLEVQGMIASLHENVFPKFRNISFYFYDMGRTRQQLFQADILIWADASVRFSSPENDELFNDAREKGLLAALPGRFFRHIAHDTALEMFQYFQLDPCSVSQFQELEANLLAFQNQPFIRDVIVETWAACALDPNCMCPEGTLNIHYCDFHVRKYAKCHRFDQSH